MTMTSTSVNSIVADVLGEAADAALRDLPFTGDFLREAKSLVMRAAAQSAEVQRKFSYAVSEKAYVAKGKGETFIATGYGTTRDTDMPSLRMPTVARRKDNRMRLRLDYLLPASAVEFFNREYARDFDFDFAHTWHHDHSEAATSKKIETEAVMGMLRQRSADFLRTPSNGYDFSVIDSGGDWRYHFVRKHRGVHTDAPFLDDRDKSRDARKRMQMTQDIDNELFVCRNKSEDCTISAPFMMAVHSSLYTTRLLTICETMASRGTLYFVGTMHLPEQLAEFNGRYVDPHYGYVVEYESAMNTASATYIPPKLRHGFGKYVFPRGGSKVVYRYPQGESREYVHDLEILQEKLEPQTFLVPTVHGQPYVYKYRVVRRVGSLAYVEIALSDEQKPAHSCLMVGYTPRPFDGYEIQFDENLIRDFQIRAFRNPVIHVPRQLFTAVAAYCLTKVRDPNFQVETAIAYVQSAANRIEANGVQVHAGTETDTYALFVIAGAAAFFWAFDRYRLMDSRLAELQIADVQSEVQGSLVNRIASLVDVTSVVDDIKRTLKSHVTSGIADFLVKRSTSYDDVRQLYESVSSLTSPGLNRIRDLHMCYGKLQELRTEGAHVAHHVGSSLVEAMVPVYPTYEVEIPRAKQVGGSESAKTDPGQSDSGVGMSSTADQVMEVSDGLDVRPIIDDMITLTEAAQAERDQTARDVFQAAFDLNTRRISTMAQVKGRVKGQPTILEYTEGQLLVVRTLSATYHKGTEEYDKFLPGLFGSRFLYPEKCGVDIKFGTGVLRDAHTFVSDRHERTSGQSFSALLDPSLRVLNATQLRALREAVKGGPVSVDTSSCVLANEVAGSGKTHAQCQMYKDHIEAGRTCAIFASTRAAAQQAHSRLTAWGVKLIEGSIMSVDAFLMNSSRWREFDHVLIDEALQLHAGKIYAVQFLTKCKTLLGFGDRKQIGYIPFTRFHKPSVVTDFPWAEERLNSVTRRIPGGRIVEALQDMTLYGPEFRTLNPRSEGLQLYVQIPSFEMSLSLPMLYRLMGLQSHHTLLVLVFLQDEALRLRQKLHLTDEMPEREEGASSGYMACVKTAGEAQGEDVDHTVLLRLAAREEPLYVNTSQTIVALTRHKAKIGIISVVSKFPALFEQRLGTPKLVGSLSDAVSQKLLPDSF